MPCHVQVYPYVMKLIVHLYGVFVYECIASACVDACSSVHLATLVHVCMSLCGGPELMAHVFFGCSSPYLWSLMPKSSVPGSSVDPRAQQMAILTSSQLACFRNSPLLLCEVKHYRWSPQISGFFVGFWRSNSPSLPSSQPSFTL